MFYMFNDQELWGWNHDQHEFAYLSLLFVKTFSLKISGMTELDIYVVYTRH